MSRTEAPMLLKDLPPGSPPQGRWTYEDYCRLPDDGKSYEVIRGVLYMAPAPTPRHQTARGYLFTALWQHVTTHDLGRVYDSPIDVILPQLANPVQPDVLYIAKERLHIVKEKNIGGAPDLVLEILSPSNPEHDSETKFAVYAEAGIKEYWIVDLPARAIEVHTLEGSAYRLHGRFTDRRTAASRLLRGFRVSVAQVCEPS